MKFFTIYNQKTGQIINSGTCLNIDIQIVPNSCLIIEVESNPSSDYVVNGEVIPLPPKPSTGAYVFDYFKKEWVEDTQEQESEVLTKRNFLLQQSDWTQIPNNPLTPEVQNEWAVYRQELRDVTSQSGYPFNVIWPTPPQG
jgi:hypothetical protein